MTLLESTARLASTGRDNSLGARAAAHCADEGPKRPATIVVALIDAFNAHAIDYCYWKSGLRAWRVFEGASDFDLLVSRAHRQRATEILLALGFKAFSDPSWRSHPAVTSFLGYAAPTGAILRVHVHFRLVAGHTLLKASVCRSRTG